MATINFIDPAVVPFVATFLFVFAVVFALLSYSKIFVRKDKEGNPVGEEPRKIYAIIAVVFGAFAIIYEPLVVGLYSYMPIAAGLLIVLFFIALLKKIFEGKEGKGTKDTFPIVVSIAILLLLFATFADRLSDYIPGGFDQSIVLWVIGIIFVIAFFWGVYKYKVQ